uniref:Oxidoreductase n=1 Tax=Arcella intermedia TaxID=1963864 RepID=A0A6B2LHQ8_9EUKA
MVGRGEVGEGIDGLAALQRVGEKVQLVDVTQIPLTKEDESVDPSLFPVKEYDEHGQQADRRVDNSWFTRIEDVSTVEMAEVHIVNTMAPFILTSKLRPLLTKDQPTFIINVSSMEGKFSRTKTAYHPHTNMAKASLNMMTRTCSREFAMHDIYMNSVDTGWITYENPLEYDSVKQILKLAPPIDEIDGASRILDPIFHALNTGEKYWGLFYKDYMPSSW